MIWVRNPWWDGFWLLSGLPLAAAFAILTFWVPAFWILAFGVMVLQTGHSLSPIALAWSHGGFRSLMWWRPAKFIWLPLGILGSAVAIGAVSSLYWPAPHFDPVTLKLGVASYWNPLFALGAVYGFWNIYHFGKQNFGVMSIYRRRAGGRSYRQADLVFCCVTGWSVMALPIVHIAANYLRTPILGYYPVLYAYLAVAAAGAGGMLYLEYSSGIFCLPRIMLIAANSLMMGMAMLFHPMMGLGIISFNHWLTAIGLAGHVSGRAVIFPTAVVIGGVILFCALFIRGWAIPTTVAAVAVAFRLALGNVHFLYDRWVWKMSDPQVRATIGKELFA